MRRLYETNEIYVESRQTHLLDLEECHVEKIEVIVEGLDTEEKRAWFGKVRYPKSLTHLMINQYVKNIRYINVKEFRDYREPSRYAR
jgi:hypothetical protein